MALLHEKNVTDKLCELKSHLKIFRQIDRSNKSSTLQVNFVQPNLDFSQDNIFEDIPLKQLKSCPENLRKF